jgi:protease I
MYIYGGIIMRLKGKRILSLVSEDFDDLELFYPMLRLKEEGALVHIAGVEKKSYLGKFGLTVEADLSFDDVDIHSYDALLVPGGWAPDKLRRYESVLNFVRIMNEKKRVIGIICHAGWVLSSADILSGRTVTSTPGIKHDLIHAGANWVDETVVVDGNLVSGRRPPDLPYYLPKLIEAIEKA